MIDPKQHNIIRAAALICVAVTSVFIMYMSYWLIDILSAPDWCARAINAEKLANSRATSGIELCKDLLLKQVSSIALIALIYAGVIALCLLVLNVIVVAGGKLNFSASKTGVTTSIGKDEVEQLGNAAAEGAKTAVDEKAEDITPVKVE